MAGDFNINLLDIIVKRCDVGDFFNAVTSHALLFILTDRFSDHQPYFASINLHHRHETNDKVVIVRERTQDSINNFNQELQTSNKLSKLVQMLIRITIFIFLIIALLK